MRILGTIVQVSAGAMADIWKHRSMGDAVAAETIGDEAFRLVSQPVQQSFEEPLGSGAIPSLLHQNIQNHALLVHGAPQIMQDTPNANEHFVQVPRISGLRPALVQSSGEVGTEFRAPQSNALVGHCDAALGENQLDVAQAEAEYMIQPNGLADDLRRKAMSGKGGVLSGHLTSLAQRQSIRQRRLIWQCPVA
jgi:hypothetical protein